MRGQITLSNLYGKYEATVAQLSLVEEVKPNRAAVICLLNLQQRGTGVYFCWILAHVGVEGNEAADKLAKRALKQLF